MSDFPEKSFPAAQNYLNAPGARATGAAQNVQSFDEITIMSEQPAKAPPWVPHNSPNKDFTGSVTKLTYVPKQANDTNVLDDAVNLRSDNQILTRATPESDKGVKDHRPTFKRRTYTDDQV